MASFDTQPVPLDLDLLEFDPTPTFLLRIGSTAIGFEILYSNEAFRTATLRPLVEAANRDATIFRSWTQAVALSKSEYGFAERIWTAQVAGANGAWKLVRASEFALERNRDHDKEEENDVELAPAETIMQEWSRDDRARCANQESPVVVKEIPRANINARWESLQTMMEMSDVGVFEYLPTGKLIGANDAWYRLSGHPRNLPAHVEFSFMDLAYPDDQAQVMSAWNQLIQGNPVTFEMRWKARPESDGAAQWVLSACVPVFDEERNLISIAGNMIDINAQKKSQEGAQARVDALEQARLSERKFARFAKLAPIAIYILKPDTGIHYANDQFFELTGQLPVTLDELVWTDLVLEEDVDRVQKDWSSMMEEKKTKQMQYRLKKTWINQDGMCSNIWVQGSNFPELNENGDVISVMGTLFNISQFIWAESVQRRRIEEALEAKRQQENFIDMTSHELRNPLSAVVQCADSVIATLQQILPTQLTSMGSEIKKIAGEIDMCVDSLQTIVSCSLHQKRVIDDVLTLSKLDSDLLLITPMRVQPSEVVSEAMKMFDVECSQMDITLEFEEDVCLKGFEWVMLDPSRLLQVLINLLTNAIKFTKDQEHRKIVVTLGGTWNRPSLECQNMTFANHGHPNMDILDTPEWGRGRKGFLWLKVDDTGCGMTMDEQKKLFSRFTQATPKTHIKYGGSGLGLFISKSLTALQGGSIGVNSEVNVGSTFMFYVSTRVAELSKDSRSRKSIRPLPNRAISTEDAMKAARLNILMVEDNLVNQKVLSKQLQKLGCNVAVAGNGVEALDWLKGSRYWRGDVDMEDEAVSRNDISDSRNVNRRYSRSSTKEQNSRRDVDIILMDIEMPIMDGLTCAKLIREYEQQGLLVASALPSPVPRRISSTSVTPIATYREFDFSQPLSPRHTQSRLPILAVSANARSEQIEQALSAGMDDAISKPFRIPELWPKMAALVPRCSILRS